MKGIERTGPNSARATRAYAVGSNGLAKVIRDAIEDLPRFTLEDGDEPELRAVRRSRIFRFEDDVTVRVSARDGGSEAVFESASRVGKGDLGQNPRNLRALLEAVYRRLS